MATALVRIGLVVLALGAATLIAVLTGQNRELRARNAVAVEMATQPQPGVFVPTFETISLDGAPVAIGGTPGERQILFFFTTTCRFCRASLPAWKQIAAAVSDTPRVAVYGISLDSAETTSRYAAEHQLPFPVLRFPEAKLMALYRVRGVPIVMVLNPEGRTVYARRGALTQRAAVDSVIAAMKAADATTPSRSVPLPSQGD